VPACQRHGAISSLLLQLFGLIVLFAVDRPYNWLGALFLLWSGFLYRRERKRQQVTMERPFANTLVIRVHLESIDALAAEHCEMDAVNARRMPRGWSDRVYSDSGRLPWTAVVDSQNWAAAGDNRPQPVTDPRQKPLPWSGRSRHAVSLDS